MNQISTGNFTSIEQAAGTLGSNTSKTVSEQSLQGNLSFEQILNEQSRKNDNAIQTVSGGLKFSKHAGERLEQRNIQLTQDQLARLEKGTQTASLKGMKEPLVLLDNMAFIVNTQNNTVVTAMKQNQNEDNIFTNIDGAVIV